MRAEEIPQELLDILDHHAGKAHGRDGKVVAALAEILSHYGRPVTEVGGYAALAVEFDGYANRLRLIFGELRSRGHPYSAIYTRDAYQELEAAAAYFRGRDAAEPLDSEGSDHAQ